MALREFLNPAKADKALDKAIQEKKREIDQLNKDCIAAIAKQSRLLDYAEEYERKINSKDNDPFKAIVKQGSSLDYMEKQNLQTNPANDDSQTDYYPKMGM